jgi:organic hydroperoxide reductase OsmC/OhrA
MATRMPLQFEVNLVRAADGRAVLEGAGKPPIVGGAPPEFGGSASVWSPEHLLLCASALCYLTTFQWLASGSGLRYDDFGCRAEGSVAKTPAGLAFTGIRLFVRVVVSPGDGARAREVLDAAKRSCLVAQSLRPPTDLVAEVVASGAVAPAA